jgi:hypothetical protein
VGAACFSLPPKPYSSEKFATTYKPSRHAFLNLFSKFLDNPSVSGLNGIREYMISSDGEGDKYLIAYKTQRRFADKFFAQIVANVEKGDVSTVRALLYLAYDLGEESLDAESRSISSELINVEKGKNLRTVKSAEYLLGVHISYNHPQLLLKAIAQEMASEKKANSDARKLAEFGLDDELFKPLCPNCPTYPVSFQEQKYRRLTSPRATDSNEMKVQNYIRKSRLAKANETPILQLRRLIFEPKDNRIEELREACYPKSSPSSQKPDIRDLGDMVNQKIVESLNKGNVEVARALVLVSNERCWNEIDNIDGPQPWLATILICHRPDIFVQATALESPTELFFEKIMKFDSPQALMNCTGQAAGSGDIQQIRLEKIKSVETVTPMEKRIVDYIVKNFSASESQNQSSDQDQNIEN